MLSSLGLDLVLVFAICAVVYALGLYPGQSAPPIDPSEVRDLDPTIPSKKLHAVLEDLCIAMQIDQRAWTDPVADGGSFSVPA